jgi:hypothetical protein
MPSSLKDGAKKILNCSMTKKLIQVRRRDPQQQQVTNLNPTLNHINQNHLLKFINLHHQLMLYRNQLPGTGQFGFYG